MLLLFVGLPALAAPCDGFVAKELRECLRANYAFTPQVEAACAGQEEGYYRWRCRQEQYAARGVVINPPILHNPPPGTPAPSFGVAAPAPAPTSAPASASASASASAPIPVAASAPTGPPGQSLKECVTYLATRVSVLEEAERTRAEREKKAKPNG